MRNRNDKIVLYVTGAIGLFSIMVLVFMNFFIFNESFLAIKEIGIKELLLGDYWHPLNTATPTYGLRNMILSTLYVSFLAVAIALFIGVGASIFLTTAVSKKTRSILLPIVDLLAGVPSVVYGFIGLAVVVKHFEKAGMVAGESVLAGAIILSIMLLPYIISSTTNTMINIQGKYSIYAKALGTSKWYTASSLILPLSLKGILISIVLATGRAMGETMAVMMVMGNAISLPTLLGKGETLSSLIALEMSAAQVGSLHFSALYFAGLILMLLLILINVAFFLLDRKLLREGGRVK